MPIACLLALAVAASGAPTAGDVSPDLAANVSAFAPAVALVPLGMAARLGPPVAYVAGPLGLSLLAIGPGAGHFLAGDPWRGAAVSAGGIAIPTSTFMLISLFPTAACSAGAGLCDANPLIYQLSGMGLGAAAGLWYYTWAVNDARETATRKNLERHALAR
jgi:hypothetical protein